MWSFKATVLRRRVGVKEFTRAQPSDSSVVGCAGRHVSGQRQWPLRDAQILARHADPRTTEHYDRARGNLDRHGVHFLTAYVAGV